MNPRVSRSLAGSATARVAHSTQPVSCKVSFILSSSTSGQDLPKRAGHGKLPMCCPRFCARSYVSVTLLYQKLSFCRVMPLHKKLCFLPIPQKPKKCDSTVTSDRALPEAAEHRTSAREAQTSPHGGHWLCWVARAQAEGRVTRDCSATATRALRSPHALLWHSSLHSTGAACPAGGLSTPPGVPAPRSAGMRPWGWVPVAPSHPSAVPPPCPPPAPLLHAPPPSLVQRHRNTCKTMTLTLPLISP